MEEWQSSRSWCKAANCLSAGRIGRNPRSGVKVGVRDKSVPVQAEQRNGQTPQPRRLRYQNHQNGLLGAADKGSVW